MYVTGTDAINQPNFLKILTSRSFEEIKIIRQLYGAIYNQDLLHLLRNTRRKNALSRAAYLRMSEPHERDAEIIRDALYGARVVDLNTLIEVICTRSSLELQSIKQTYHSQYNSDIEQDVTLKAHGGFKEILFAVLKSSRNCDGRVDRSMSMCDAKTLYEAMESGKSVDQKTIISLISQRSSGQFKSILESYKELYGKELSKSLKRTKCGQFGKDLRVVVRCVQHSEKYFAKKLRGSMNTFDTQETLIRILVTRSGIELKDINNAYRNKTGCSLESFVRREFNKISTEKENALAAEFLVGLLNYS
ncbi:Annexin a13 [Thalictrum thalictroides]|uniref:Annexin a13 n=1 Tax=Thalictrum thalictroides TaxID=46969 RepID=A0A7J6VVU9_THATH|nr:Annexin a13 [Thalictrum thalictroides]